MSRPPVCYLVSCWSSALGDRLRKSRIRLGGKGHTPPVLAVSDAVFERRVAEMVFSVNAAGTLGKSWVELVHCEFCQLFPILQIYLVLLGETYD